MKVFIALEAYQDASQWRFLDQIVNRIADGWHVWEIEDPDSVEQSGWMSGPGRAWIKDLFEKAALASSYPVAGSFPRCRVQVAIHTSDSNELSPEKAAKFLSTPLTVLVENRFTDGEIFLNEVLNLLGCEKLNRLRLIAPGAIYYDSPGGIGELPKLVVDYVQRAGIEGLPVRALVFTDCDGEVPGEIERKARRVQDVCKSCGLPCFTLSKRTIENYIPDEVFDAWDLPPDSDKGRRVAALKRLTDPQRDHYPMKTGLKLDKAPSSVRDLYRDVSDEDKAILSDEGFGKDVIKKMQKFRNALSASALRRRDGRGELDGLVKLIEDAL